MRKKNTLNLGIAALALSASLFLGCQDLLSEDKSVQSAKTSSETAKDMPALVADTAKPAATEPATTPAVQDNAAECKEIYAQMQTAKEPLYGELKFKFTSLNCDSKAAGPYVPPDSATLCKNLKATLAMLDPSSPKYPMYQQEIATYCTDANTPAAPVAPSPVATTPAAPDNAAECKDIYAQMQTAKEPLYGELKNKFGSLKCDLSQAAGPYVPPTPPDSATVCKNFQTSLAQMDPSSSKYSLYLEQIAIYCTAKP